MGRPPLSSALKTTAHEKGAIAMASREDNRRLAEAYNEAMGIGDTNLDEELTDDPDGFTHDYAACKDPICALCDAYGDGYTAGKERRLTSMSVTGTRRNTRPPAAVTRVWPRGR